MSLTAKGANVSKTMTNWVAFYKAKYREWHVGVPSENSNMNIALFPDGVPGGDSDESKAIARLIAAAPDLLAACKRLAIGRHFDRSNGGEICTACGKNFRDEIHYRWGESHQTDQDFARAAIAKAEAEE